MNWLAHLYLSEPTPEFRLGNLLPDFLGPAALAALPREMQRGAERHRQIDAFTDAHPIFLRSVGRVAAPHRRFGRIIVDVLYDHFLSVDWAQYSGMPLEQFTREIYPSFELVRPHVPEAVSSRLQQIREVDLLSSYRTLAGVELALVRIGARLRQPRELGSAVTALEPQYKALHAEFTEFFADLRRHVERAPAASG